MIFTNLKDVSDVAEFIKYNATALQATERDGFGYTIQGSSGLFGERTESSKFISDYFVDEKLPKAPWTISSSNTFGTLTDILTGAGMFHGRISTNNRSLINTHPLQKHGWTLIHNGVVTDHGPKYTMITDNDTEHVLERLATGGIEAVAKNLSGYYAVGAIDPKGNLHIFKDNIASLYSAWVIDLKSWMFATTEDLIVEFCENFEYEHGPIEKVKDDTYLVFKANKLKSQSKFNSRGYDKHSAGLATKSLGREIDIGSEGVISMTGNFDNGVKQRVKQKTDLEYFFEEVNFADESYTILDYWERPIPLDDFKLLADEDKLACTIIRPDGTIVDSNDYFSDKLHDYQRRA